jgi:D-3-phosphoglycerate dehydrogenase
MGGRRRILIAEPRGFSPKALDLLRSEVDVDQRELRAEDLSIVLDQYDALWFRLAFRFESGLISTATRCRVLATPVTGIDHIDLEACERAGIAVVSLKGEYEFLRDVRATAELTVGILLALLRRIPQAYASTVSGEWNRDAFRGHELYGKTIGIVGVGRLGSLVAGYFRAFGCNVLGHDVLPRASESVEMVSTLGELLARSDIVSVHVAYEESTRDLLSRAQFAGFKRGSYLVNTSRGGVVDEEALLWALEEGILAGAALDVLTGEPAVDDRHPVIQYARGHSNVLVVPHIGGNTYESFEKTEVFLSRKVLSALREVPGEGGEEN